MNQCPVKRQWPRLFEHIRNGYLKPSDIVTHRIPLEHIAEGYHMFSAKLDGCIKPLVVPARGLRRRTTMAYTADKPPLPSRTDELRARIPGWGVDLDPADRPSVPRERLRPDATGAHWDFPERQPEQCAARAVDRARVPDAGVRHRAAAHGAVRRAAQARRTDGTARGGPRTGCCWCSATGSTPSRATCGRSLTLRPDNPVTETGVLASSAHPDLRSRLGRAPGRPRAPAARPVIVAGPWVLAAIGGIVAGGARGSGGAGERAPRR